MARAIELRGIDPISWTVFGLGDYVSASALRMAAS